MKRPKITCTRCGWISAMGVRPAALDQAETAAEQARLLAADLHPAGLCYDQKACERMQRQMQQLNAAVLLGEDLGNDPDGDCEGADYPPFGSI